MKLDNIVILEDKRVNSLSVSATTTIGEYIKWFEDYGCLNQLEEQRPVLNTRSANKIRMRLVDDLTRGAIIPPIVIGMSVDNDLSTVTTDTFVDLFIEKSADATVIDGIQRSEALLAAALKQADIVNYPLRVDFWIANDAISLVYRMLVLNAGQTPWNVKRQMEVIYKPLINEIKAKIPGIDISVINEGRRRAGAGMYPSSSIIEMFLAFSSRKEILNFADNLADDFTRLDVAQMAGKPECSEFFYHTIKLLYEFDKAIERFKENDDAVEGHYKKGSDLFVQLPSKVGFVAAIAQKVLGRAGMPEKSYHIQQQEMDKISNGFNNMIATINALENEHLKEFLAFDILNETVNSLPKRKIGDSQREFFRKGFSTLIESDFDVDSLEVVWRAF